MSNDVHRGRDGWLYLSGGSNDVLRYYLEPDHFRTQLIDWVELLETRRRRAEAMGMIYRHLLVPDKLSVYPEYYLGPLDYADAAPSRALPRTLSAETSPVLVDLLKAFDAVKAERDVYYRTDAHWNVDGAMTAYEALCASVGAPANPDLGAAPALRGEIPLDLGGKLDPPILEAFVTTDFVQRGRRVETNSLVAFKEETGLIDAPGLHVGSRVVFQNDHATDPRRLVLFGDSYSEYRNHLLTGMLAETFAEVHFIWNASVDWGYVERVAPDILVTQLAERFMTQVPTDDLDIDAFAEARLAQFKSEQAQQAAIGAFEDQLRQAPATDLVEAWRSVLVNGVGGSVGDGVVSFRAARSVLLDATLRITNGRETLWVGEGLVEGEGARYALAQDDAEGVDVQIHLGVDVMARAVRAQGPDAFTVFSSLSPYPLAVVRPADWNNSVFDVRHLDRAEQGLQWSQWGIDAVFADENEIHILGWALPPSDQAGQPSVTVNDMPASQVFPAITGQTGLYWFHSRAQSLGFYARGPLPAWNSFAKIEIKWPTELNDPFDRRYPVYNWIGVLDAWDLPPDESIHRVSGPTSNGVSYLNGGFSDYHRFRRLAQEAGVTISAETRLLDWGCGCGRVIRHFMDEGVQVTGIDIDALNIAWCRDHLAPGRFETVDLMPPTPLEDNSFDVIISSSVLSHLTEEVMNEWLAEMNRVLTPGGVALLSYNGDGTSYLYAAPSVQAVSKLDQNGFFDEWKTPDLDSVISDREYYRLTLMTDARAQPIFERHFELAGVAKGVVSGHQNVAILRKKGSPAVRRGFLSRLFS